MATTAQVRTPIHLWVVGILSLLWNAGGGYDYYMTRTENAAYLKSAGGDPAALLAYMAAMPLYAQVGWAVGVWASLLGSVLLLMRSRYAVHAFGISLLGALVSFASQIMGPAQPAQMTAGVMKYIPFLIIALIAVQLWYASRETKAGVLR